MPISRRRFISRRHFSHQLDGTWLRRQVAERAARHVPCRHLLPGLLGRRHPGRHQLVAVLVAAVQGTGMAQGALLGRPRQRLLGRPPAQPLHRRPPQRRLRDRRRRPLSRPRRRPRSRRHRCCQSCTGALAPTALAAAADGPAAGTRPVPARARPRSRQLVRRECQAPPARSPTRRSSTCVRWALAVGRGGSRCSRRRMTSRRPSLC